MNMRDCRHEECPYKYCQHNKYWDGTEYSRLTMSQKIIVPDADPGDWDDWGKTVDNCMSYMDI